MPFGRVTIASDGANVTKVALGEVALSGKEAADELTNECASQLLEYLSGKRTVFDIPISFSGTPFQMEAWKAMTDIPYSQTRTAKELAVMIEKPGSYRQIGSAVRENPLVILIPAHRVVPSSGRIDSNDPHARLRAAFRDLEKRFA